MLSRTHWFLTLTLTLGLAILTATQAVAAPSQEVDERVAARCLDYGELARVSAHMRHNDVPMLWAFEFSHEVMTRQGVVAGSRTDQERQEIVRFVYERPWYSPEEARDQVILWCTQQWLPRK
jgi:hypothetical protein